RGDGAKQTAAPLVEAPAPTPVPEPKAPERTSQRSHTLKRGDTYFQLSKRYYGTIRCWNVIRDANRQWKVLESTEGLEVVIPALRREDMDGNGIPVVTQGAASNPIPPMRG